MRQIRQIRFVPFDSFRAAGPATRRRAVLGVTPQSDASYHLAVVDMEGRDWHWPPRRVLATFPVTSMIQTSRTLLAKRRVMFCDIEGNRIIFRSLCIRTLEFNEHLCVTDPYPAAWPIGVDVDRSGRRALLAWATERGPSFAVYHSFDGSVHQLDCSELAHEEFMEVRWGETPMRQIRCRDVVSEDEIELPVEDRKVRYMPRVLETLSEEAAAAPRLLFKANLPSDPEWHTSGSGLTHALDGDE